jgi:hypothetical protein
MKKYFCDICKEEFKFDDGSTLHVNFQVLNPTAPIFKTIKSGGKKWDLCTTCNKVLFMELMDL